METFWQAVVIIGGGLTAALVGLWYARRRARPASLKQHHEVAGFVVAVVGVMYGVLLASVVIMVWSQFDETRHHVEHEAGDLASLYRMAEGMPQPDQADIQVAIRRYSASVIDDEWPTMSEGEFSPLTQEAMNGLWTEVRDFEPQSVQDETIFDHLLELLQGITEMRRARIIASDDALSPLFWMVLVAGAAITIIYCYFFGVEDPQIHTIIVALLTLMICLNLFLIASLDKPFYGLIRISPRAFELVRTMMVD